MDPDTNFPSFEDAMAAANRASADEAPEASESPVAPVVAAPAATPAPAPEVAPTALPAAPVEPAISPRLAKLMEREAALQEREARLADPAYWREEARKQFKADKVRFIQELDPESPLDHVAKDLWGASLGDLAPPEYRITNEVRALRQDAEKKHTELEAKIARRDEELAQQQRMAVQHQYEAALGAAAQAVGDDHPLVKPLVQEDPARVAAGLFQIAQQIAHTQNRVPTPAECLTELQARLARSVEKLGLSKAPVAATAPAPKTPVATPPSTVWNSASAVQPTTTPDDDLDDEVLHARAMAAVAKIHARETEY